MKHINKNRIFFNKSNLLDELFDPAFYIAQYPDVAGFGSPFSHYKKHGWKELRSPNPFFDPHWYRTTNPDIGSEIEDLIPHYFESGEAEGRWPHPLFNPKWYAETHPDVKAHGMSPLLHFLRYGLAEGREFSPLFSINWYRNKYSGLIPPGHNPVLFFLIDPRARETDPGTNFSSSWYLADNPDVRAAGVHPYLHYLKYGRSEGRPPVPYTVGAQFLSKDLVLGVNSFNTSYDQQDVEPSLLEHANLDIDLEKTKLVSFDVWSTLLHRRCYPDEIKLQSARFLLLMAFLDLKNAYRSVNELYWSRILCENQSAPNGDFEYRFEQAIPLWLSQVLAPGTLPHRVDALAGMILEHELRAEARSTLRDDVTSAFAYNLTQPKIFVSDFYMPARFISNLLARHNVGGIWTKGYSSSDYFKNKREGGLFQQLLADFAVKPEEVLHIGDNKVADKQVPTQMGFRTHLYDSPSETMRMEWYKHAFQACLENDFRLHQRRILAKLEEKCGTECRNSTTELDLYLTGIRLSPIVFYFVLSVIEDAIKNGDRTVYFFTREGLFFKKVYDEIVRANPFNCEYPEARILAVSRRATFAASLNGFTVSELMRLWSMYSIQSLQGFATSLNFDVGLIEKIGRRYDLPLKKPIVHPWLDRTFLRFLKDTELLDHARESIAKQRKTLLLYLDQQGVTSQERVAIVDIGWRGTIQDNLSWLLNRPVRGHYLALFSFLNKQRINSQKVGWLGDNNDVSAPKFPDQVAPLEMIFNGSGGSVVGYEVDATGTLSPIRHIIPSEEEVIYETASLQDGMLAAMADLTEYVRLHGLMASSLKGLARSIALKLLESPPCSVADLFAKLVHNETFGTGEAQHVGKSDVLHELSMETKRWEIHGKLTSLITSARWPEGAVATSTMREWWNSAEARVSRAAPTAVARLCNPTYLKIVGSNLNIYVPAVLKSSGGHRTIYNMAHGLAESGFQINIYSDGPGAGLDVIEEYLAGAGARLHSTWEHSSNAQVAFATIAHSARFVAETVTAKHKFYLVQDAEALFNPVGDTYIEAENSYAQGLNHITVGNWLTHVIRTRYRGKAEPAGLGVDTTVYKRLDNGKRDKAICMLFQPEKPRRGNAIAIKALEIVKEKIPDLSIYLYGSDQHVALPFDAVQLGLVVDLKELNVLYNKCRVGLCLSLSNPSRIPFEMTSAGCLPVDVYRYNNLLDYESGAAVLAYQSPSSIAAAIESAFRTSENTPDLSAALSKSVAARTLQWEVDMMVSHVIAGIEQRETNLFDVSISYQDLPVIGCEEDVAAARAFCEWQRHLSGGSS